MLKDSGSLPKHILRTRSDEGLQFIWLTNMVSFLPVVVLWLFLLNCDICFFMAASSEYT